MKEYEDSFRDKPLRFLHILLTAAIEKEKFFQVIFSFDEWLNKTRKEFGLSAATSRLLKSDEDLRGKSLNVYGFRDKRTQWPTSLIDSFYGHSPSKSS